MKSPSDGLTVEYVGFNTKGTDFILRVSVDKSFQPRLLELLGALHAEGQLLELRKAE